MLAGWLAIFWRHSVGGAGVTPPPSPSRACGNPKQGFASHWFPHFERSLGMPRSPLSPPPKPGHLWKSQWVLGSVSTTSSHGNSMQGCHVCCLLAREGKSKPKSMVVPGGGCLWWDQDFTVKSAIFICSFTQWGGGAETDQSPKDREFMDPLALDSTVKPWLRWRSSGLASAFTATSAALALQSLWLGRLAEGP